MKRSRAKKQPARTPCLRLERRGGLQIEYFPRAGVETPQGTFVADAVVKASLDGRRVSAMVEIDEGPVPTPESVERERMAGMPTIRVNPARLEGQDMGSFLEACLRNLLGVVA